MTNKQEKRRDMLIEIAHMYYVEGMSQEQISKKLDVSRSNISRLLKLCLEQKIVEIKINYTSSRGIYIQEKLKEKFGVDVRIVSGMGSTQTIKSNVGKGAADYLNSILKDGMKIGMAWGSTIHELVEHFNPEKKYSVDVVQLIGGTDEGDLNFDGFELTKRLAEKFHGNSYVFHAPLVVQNKDLKDLFMKEPYHVKHFELAKKVDIALVGIGSSDPEADSLLRAGHITKSEAAQLTKQGVVGNICANHIDVYGNCKQTDLSYRTIGIPLEDIEKIPMVVGVACGEEKVEPVLGSLRGKLIDVLITDEQTGQSLLTMVDEEAE